MDNLISGRDHTYPVTYKNGIASSYACEAKICVHVTILLHKINILAFKTSVPQSYHVPTDALDSAVSLSLYHEGRSVT